MRTLTISLVALVFLITAFGAATTFRNETAASPKRVVVLDAVPVADTGETINENDNGTSTFRREAEEAEDAARGALDAARRYADRLGEKLQKKVDEWGEQAGEALADDLDALQKELNKLEQRLDDMEKEYDQEQEREQPAEREGLTTI